MHSHIFFFIQRKEKTTSRKSNSQEINMVKNSLKKCSNIIARILFYFFKKETIIYITSILE